MRKHFITTCIEKTLHPALKGYLPLSFSKHCGWPNFFLFLKWEIIIISEQRFTFSKVIGL